MNNRFIEITSYLIRAVMIILEHKTFNETQCKNPSVDIHDLEEQPLNDMEHSTIHPSEGKCYLRRS